jgi:hypothetical protein
MKIDSRPLARERYRWVVGCLFVGLASPAQIQG